MFCSVVAVCCIIVRSLSVGKASGGCTLELGGGTCAGLAWLWLTRLRIVKQLFLENSCSVIPVVRNRCRRGRTFGSVGLLRVIKLDKK